MKAALNRHALTAILGGSGVLHLVEPAPYRRIVPHFLGHQAELVALSGVAELLCAAAIQIPATRRVGGWMAAALLIAVFPANVQMAVDGGIAGAGFPLNSALVSWLRLPLQVPLVLMALAVTREGR